MAITVSPEVSSLLQRSTIEGAVLRLPAEQLARPLYAATDKVLQALGGKWNKKAGGHVFPFDPAPKIEEAVGGGRVVSRQQKLQHFDTPLGLADLLVAKLGHIGGASCLEPSAGRGNIVSALASRDPGKVVAVEIDADNVAALRDQRKSHAIYQSDFLATQLGSDFDCVAMNPPFTRNQDIKHVRHAYECLKAGGCLAAIVSCHGFLGQEREAIEWREWLSEVGAEVDDIPAGAFKESGTSIATKMVFIRKAAFSRGKKIAKSLQVRETCKETGVEAITIGGAA